MTAAPDPAKKRIAYLSYSTAQFDSRTQRMARSAIDAGYDVTVYARWEPGLPMTDAGPGYRILRAPVVPELAVPGLRGRGRRRLAALQRAAATASTTGAPPSPRAPSARQVRPDAGPVRRVWRSATHWLRVWVSRLVIFPVRPTAWAIALDEVAEPADLWHGMWAGSLPALGRLRRRFGGATLYDSRDVYIHARGFDTMGRPWRWLLGGLERRWARGCDEVITVNDAYAAILARQFRIPLPAVVRNTPARYALPDPPPDRLRTALGLPATTSIVLYQGGLMTERGIEQGMEAILQVPDAVLVLMGYGAQRDMIVGLAATPRYAERVRTVDPVPPSELLDWTASADVMLMAIQPTTLNHRFTTPNKLWEAIAAGVPVVASDLPGMAEVVRAAGCGVLVDPTDPADIARGILEILHLPEPERAALSARTVAAGQTTYNWESQVGVLLDRYRDLLARGRPAGPR